MTRPTFDNLTREQADKYCAFVQEAHPLKVMEFAAAYRAAGRDPKALDGSTDSLVPIWQWVLHDLGADYENLPLPGPGSAEKALGIHDDPSLSRATLVSEWLEHYMFELVHHLDPHAHWAVFPRVKKGRGFMQTHETVIESRGQYHTNYNRFIGARSMALDGEMPWSPDDALKKVVIRSDLRGEEVPAWANFGSNVPDLDQIRIPEPPRFASG